MVTKNDIQILSVKGNESQNKVTVEYQIGGIPDTIDFHIVNGSLVVSSDMIFMAKMGTEINQDIIRGLCSNGTENRKS